LLDRVQDAPNIQFVKGRFQMIAATTKTREKVWLNINGLAAGDLFAEV
jgi:hypothetical protein